MEQGCPHRSILPHIFPDCNSFAIKIEGKFCGVRGVCPGGGLPRRCRRGGRQRYPAGGLAPALPARRASAVPGGRVPALSPAYPATVVPVGGACLLCRLLTLPLTCFFAPIPLPPSRREGGDQGYFMQGASPLASPGLNPRGTGSPCRCGKLNGGLAPALPARRASAIPGGGLACFAACLPCL